MIVNRNSIKSTLPLLAESVRFTKRRKNELLSLPRHLRRRKAQINNSRINRGIIKVVFICQYIPAWSKNKQLYETLKNDSRFDTVLLCIPDRVHSNQLDDPDNMSNDVFDYFSEQGYSDALNALTGKNVWIDLRALHPDYVIYNRYDRSMPLQYTSTAVSEYAKVCLVKYASTLLKSEISMLDKGFIANTFCYFAESKEMQQEYKRWNSVLCRLKLCIPAYCGTPAVENAYKAKDDISTAWDFSDSGFRAIYAPRWTMASQWGGSSFPEYKDAIISLADKIPGLDILIRPHPLMFDHFISAGIMTEEEVDQYKEKCLSRDNIRLDKEKEYQATFWGSDVLICDFSSMIIEYFITGKPIIYLTYDENIDYSGTMAQILSGCYIVKNKNELQEVLEELMKGNDTLAQIRKAVLDKEYREKEISAVSDKMKQVLIQGYNM